MPDPNEDDEDLDEFDDEDEDLEDDEEDLEDEDIFDDEDDDEDEDEGEDDVEDLDGDDDLDLDELEEDEEDEMQTRNNAAHPHRQPVRTKGGVRADDDLAAERLENSVAGEKTHEHQDELLDEGVEETFPASDPVSVKQIT